MGVPVRLHICGNITPLLDMLAEVEADLVDLDSMVSGEGGARKAGAFALPGREHQPRGRPAKRDATEVETGLEACFREAGGAAYAVAAGCEVPRDTPAPNLLAMAHFARATAIPDRPDGRCGGPGRSFGPASRPRITARGPGSAPLSP